VNAPSRRGGRPPVAMAMHLLGGLRLVHGALAHGPGAYSPGAADAAVGAAGAAEPAGRSATDHGAGPNLGADGLENRHHVRALLALAGSSSQGIGRDELVELLWPNLGPTQGRNRLYHTVHLARKALSACAWEDEWVVVRNSHVVVDERVWCDVRELEATARQADDLQERRAGAGDLQALLPLCSGEWMPDLEIGAVGEALRGRVRKLQATVLRRVAQLNQTQGDTPSQRALLNSLLQLEATDEWAYRELMRMDLAAGRRHAVLRHFDKLSRALGAQLGLRPSAATSALAASASASLQQSPGATEGALRGSLLVGREALIQDLVAQTKQQAGLWLVTGQSGIGKTALVREVAHRLAPLLADGVCIVSLGDQGDTGGAAARESATAVCVRMLGLAPAAGRDDGQRLEQALRHRQMLLVLDDLDVAADAQALLAQLPLQALQARVIVTCRAPLAHCATVPHVHVQVPPLAVPAVNAGLTRATESASFTLFRMRCPVPDDQQARAEWQHDAVRLVRKLDGLPLAIELAAARTATMTPGEILLHIERNLDTLTDGPMNLEGRHRSLRASLDWSVQLLSPMAHAVYRAVSVFAGAFDRRDVTALMPALATQAGDNATSGTPAGTLCSGRDVQAGLQELLAGGLLARVHAAPDKDRPDRILPQQAPSSAPGRAPTEAGLMADGDPLRMLHLPRAHARAQALARGQWRALVDLRLAQICTVFEAHPLQFDNPRFAAHLQQVVALEGEALSLLDHAQQHHPKRYVQLLATLCESWACQGAGGSILRHVDAGIEAAQICALPVEGLSLRISKSYALRTRGNGADAEAFSSSLLALVQAPQLDQGGPAAVVLVLRLRAIDARAMCLVQVGRKEEAIDLLLSNLQTYRLQSKDAGYWIVHTRVAYLTTRLRAGVHIELDALRQKYEGSPLWIEILRASYEDTGDGLDWVRRQAVGEEIVACARRLRSPLLLFIGIWSKACGQMGNDDTAGGLQSMQEAIALARHGGLEHLALDALPMLAVWQRYAMKLDAAEKSLREISSLPPMPGRDTVVVRVPIQTCAISCLRGQPEAGRTSLLAVSVDRLQIVRDEELIRWAESAALLAKALGQSSTAHSLARAFRPFNFDLDQVPVIARFRDREFGAQAAQAPPSEAQINALRAEIRALLETFHAGLQTDPQPASKPGLQVKA
jgi:DNA-binding SARP family transcriptional activator